VLMVFVIRILVIVPDKDYLVPEKDYAIKAGQKRKHFRVEEKGGPGGTTGA